MAVAGAEREAHRLVQAELAKFKADFLAELKAR
jgi:hypothetical protein